MIQELSTTLSNITDDFLQTLGTDDINNDGSTLSENSSSSSSVDNSVNTTQQENSSTSITELNRYKLDQLKLLANQLGVSNPESIRKMKKQEIINAIKNFRK
jgi:hypothetical protein